MIGKLVGYIMHVRRLNKQFQFPNSSILAMDETPVWNDMVWSTTVDETDSKDVPLKTTGLEKVRVSVCVAAKGDGTKLKPFVSELIKSLKCLCPAPFFRFIQKFAHHYRSKQIAIQ